MTKRIGIVGQYTGDIFGVNENYIEFATLFGQPIVISPVQKDLWFKTYGLDGLILPGGADVAYWRYSKMWNFWQGRPNWHLETFDLDILPQLIGRIPIFGICRGLQTLNVHFGGTLHRHLFRHPYSKHNKDTVHNVRERFSGKVFGVNSFHHQCIKDLGKDLTAEVITSDGIIEAISNEKLKIFAVQWHPERLRDDYSIDKAKELFK